MRQAAAFYRGLARAAARRLGGLDGVVGVYARRSVAAGEVVFPWSDIDLHVVIAEPATPAAEGELLARIADRWLALKRLVRCLGHLDVSTRAELEQWYLDEPFQRHRDHGWLRLHGDEFERPVVAGWGPDASLWGFFFSARQVPDLFRAGNARSCCNVVLDMFDVYRLYAAGSGEPLTRGELVDLWYESRPPSPERTAIRTAYRCGFRGRQAHLLEPIYRESLALQEALYARVEHRLEGEPAGELRSSVPPGYVPARYLVVAPDDRVGVDAALAATRRDPRASVLTANGLKLYLAYGNPWEYAALAAANPALRLRAPQAESYRLGARLSLHAEIPRGAAFAGNQRVVGAVYMQRRLYADHGIVAASRSELDRRYAECYGAPLETDTSRDEYFRGPYLEARRVMDELLARRAAL